VQEGGIADDRNDAFLFVGLAPTFVHAVGHAQRGAHAGAGVQRVPGVAGAEGIAADITDDVEVANVGERKVRAKMRAGGTHGWRAREDIDTRPFRHLIRFAQQGFDGWTQHTRCQFAEAGQDILAVHV